MSDQMIVGAAIGAALGSVSAHGVLERIASQGQSNGDFQLTNLAQAAIRERNLVYANVATMAITGIVILYPSNSTIGIIRRLAALILCILASNQLKNAGDNFIDYCIAIDDRLELVDRFAAIFEDLVAGESIEARLNAIRNFFPR